MPKKPDIEGRRNAVKAVVFGGIAAAAAFGQAPSNSPPPPYTDIDRTGWPALNEDEKRIRDIRLSEKEAYALMEYKINHYILNNDSVMGRLGGHGINPTATGKIMAKDVIMPNFYNGVIQELAKHNVWDPPSEANMTKEERMTAGNVWDHFWRRASAHVQIDDIIKQWEEHHGKLKTAAFYAIHFETAERIRRSYPFYLKVLGPAEAWRGKVPIDLEHLEVSDDGTIADIARRRSQFNFPKILNNLEIQPDSLLKIQREDLVNALHMNVDAELEKLQRRTAWVDRKDGLAGQERS